MVALDVYAVQTPPPLIRHARACHLLPRSGRRQIVSALILHFQRTILEMSNTVSQIGIFYQNRFAIEV